MTDAMESMLQKVNNFRYSSWQGNAVFFVMCSERPEYANKIYSMHGLAPIAFFSTVRSPVINSMVASIDFLRVSITVQRLAINKYKCYLS